MTVQEIKEYMDNLRSENQIEDIRFFSQEVKRLTQIIKQYPKMTKDKQERFAEAYERTIERRNNTSHHLKNLIETYEKQKEAEEFFART